MENIRRKNKMMETYSILLIDIVSAVVAYALALFIRFRVIHYENYPKQFHLMVGAYIVVLCLLYNMFLDGNRNFITRSFTTRSGTRSSLWWGWWSCCTSRSSPMSSRAPYTFFLQF